MVVVLLYSLGSILQEKKKKTSTTEGKKDPTVPLFHGGMFGRP